MELAREHLKDVTVVFATTEATYYERRELDSEVEGGFPQYMERLQKKKHALMGEVLNHLGLQWVAPVSSSRLRPMHHTGENPRGSLSRKDDVHPPTGVFFEKEARTNTEAQGARAWPEEEQPPRNRVLRDDQAAAERSTRRNQLLENAHEPIPNHYDGSTEWGHGKRESVENRVVVNRTLGGRTSRQGGRFLKERSWDTLNIQIKEILQHDQGIPPLKTMTRSRVVPSSNEGACRTGDLNAARGGVDALSRRPPSSIPALYAAALIESTSSPDGASSFVRADGGEDKRLGKVVLPVPAKESAYGRSHLPPPRTVVEHGDFRRLSPLHVAVTNPSIHHLSPLDRTESSTRKRESKHFGDEAVADAAEGVLGLRKRCSPVSHTVKIKKAREVEGVPSANSKKQLHTRTTASGVRPSSHTQGAAGRKQKQAAHGEKAAQACRDVGCHRRPIYAYVGDTKALCCPIHRSKEMVNVRHPLCRHETCYRQPSFGMEGAPRASFCSEHKLPEMINVSSRRCRAPGCLRHPNFGFQGDRRASYCCRHKAPGMMDVVSRRCQHNQCLRRPLYAMAGQRAIFCRTHKDSSMTDVVSRRCDFEEGCNRHPSFGWKQTDGRARRCAHHRLKGMESVKVNRRNGSKVAAAN